MNFPELVETEPITLENGVTFHFTFDAFRRVAIVCRWTEESLDPLETIRRLPCWSTRYTTLTLDEVARVLQLWASQ